MKRPSGGMSVRSKLLLGSLSLLGLMSVAVGYGIYSIARVGSELTEIADQDIPLTERVMHITVGQLGQATKLERALRYGMVGQFDPAAMERFEQLVRAFETESAAIRGQLEQADETLTGFIENARSAKSKTAFTEAQQALGRIGQEYEDYVEHASEALSQAKTGGNSKLNVLLKQLEAEEAQIDRQLQALLTDIEQFTANSAVTAKNHEHRALVMLLVITAVALVLGLIMSWVFSGRLVRALREAINVAQGDLTRPIEVTRGDEIGQLLEAMNGMRGKLLGVVNEISGGTDQLSTSAEELAAVTEQTQANIQQQQTDTDQVATAVNEMNASAQEVARNIAAAAQEAAGADTETRSGQQVVEQAIAKIQHLAEQLESASQSITQLEKDSENISSILDVITGISEQTNLLALNAAIEAARAGEQGRGFAVVADEVRTLASRTQDSTNEINQMIERLQRGSREAVGVMTTSRDEAREAVDYATNAGASLRTIAEAVSRINEMNTQIASAAEQQSAVVEDITQKIVAISDRATENVAGAQQTAAAGQTLSELAVNLRDTVNRFQT